MGFELVNKNDRERQEHITAREWEYAAQRRKNERGYSVTFTLHRAICFEQTHHLTLTELTHHTNIRFESFDADKDVLLHIPVETLHQDFLEAAKKANGKTEITVTLYCCSNIKCGKHRIVNFFVPLLLRDSSGNQLQIV
jgi:hypothetical protein